MEKITIGSLLEIGEFISPRKTNRNCTGWTVGKPYKIIDKRHNFYEVRNDRWEFRQIEFSSYRWHKHSSKVREKITTRDQQAIEELASIVDDLIELVNDIGGIGYGSTTANLKKRINRVIDQLNPPQD